MMCRPSGKRATPFTQLVWPRIVWRGMIAGVLLMEDDMVRACSLNYGRLWTVYTRKVRRNLGLRPGYLVAAMISGASRGLSSFNSILVRITQAMAHDTACSRDPILMRKTSNVCRCYEIREYARDLCGYLKSWCSISRDQWVSGWELRKLRKLRSRSFMLFLKLCPMRHPRVRFTAMNLLHSASAQVCDRRYVQLLIHMDYIYASNNHSTASHTPPLCTFFRPMFELQHTRDVPIITMSY
ncbi:uncharacterized protein BJ212DRAFT_1366388 [Suillus subaureus]|uniref:Uncharacterized protein n=1 Tax=Suillus subaureus TaxID=48587 RepID=A0A9P7JC18_9AGAM|nr:uncharacterized protein BJ212DRAFT_1366388 [Suillus subaureus]KAG1813649.1 hypothetical protein BJ212DRAFT_1366388 [Suillus subaureus]